MVMFAMPKGQVVEPLIRDSRRFALCQIREGDRYLMRKFEPDSGSDRLEPYDRNGPRAGSIENIEDPFVCLPTRTSSAGSPIIERALGYLDCEVIRQIETEGDHRIYVGLIDAAEILQEEPPAIFCGMNGAA